MSLRVLKRALISAFTAADLMFTQKEAFKTSYRYDLLDFNLIDLFRAVKSELQTLNQWVWE